MKSVSMEKGYGQAKTSFWECKLHMLAARTHNKSLISRKYRHPNQYVCKCRSSMVYWGHFTL